MNKARRHDWRHRRDAVHRSLPPVSIPRETRELLQRTRELDSGAERRAQDKAHAK